MQVLAASIRLFFASDFKQEAPFQIFSYLDNSTQK